MILVIVQQSPLLCPCRGIPLLVLIPTLFACYAYLYYSYDTSFILLYILPHHATTYHIYSSIRLAVKFGIFSSLLPRDYHAANVALPTLVPAGPPKVHLAFPMWPPQSLLVPCVLHYLLPQHYHCQGLTAVLH